MCNEHLIVGKIGAPYGVKGWVKIFSINRSPESLLEYETWYVESQNGWEILEISERKRHDGHVIAHIAGIDDREIAKQFTNKQISILPTQLPKAEKNEFYWLDLEGLKVITKDGEELGQIDNMMETGANDVMIVVGNKKRLIPFVLNKTVLSVDLKKKEIIVDWDPSY